MKKKKQGEEKNLWRMEMKSVSGTRMKLIQDSPAAKIKRDTELIIQ